MLNSNNEEIKYLTYEDIKKKYKSLKETCYGLVNNHYEAIQISIIDDMNDIRGFDKMKNRLLNIEEEDIFNFFYNYFQLFDKSISSYNLLNVLSIIYETDVANILYGDDYKIKLTTDKKIKLLEKSFDIFKNLEKREEILNYMIRNNWNEFPYILLNEYRLLCYLCFTPALFISEKRKPIIDDIFSNINKQR